MYYINKILKYLNKAEPKTISTKSSASPMNMSAVDEGYEKLRKYKSETFHKFVEICY